MSENCLEVEVSEDCLGVSENCLEVSENCLELFFFIIKNLTFYSISTNFQNSEHLNI